MHRILNLGLLAALCLLAACQGEPSTPGLGESAVIFSAEEAARMGAAPWIAGSEPIEGFWTPTPLQVQALEAQLPEFLASHATRFRREVPPWQSLADYRVQYLGIQEGGMRLIYANFFCQPLSSTDWRQELVAVNDGGDCFFQLRYDPAREEFLSLEVNGEA